MGKRSEFPRIAQDAYPTPAEAVAPLLPHLEPGRRFHRPGRHEARGMIAAPSLEERQGLP